MKTTGSVLIAPDRMYNGMVILFFPGQIKTQEDDKMLQEFKNYSHILFDADNTLLDFTRAEKNALELTFQALGIILREDVYRLYVEINHRAWQEYEAGLIDSSAIPHKRFSELIDAADLAFDVDSVSRIYQDYLGQQTCLVPYAREICEYWSKKAVVSIITNGFKETQQRRVMASELRPSISHLIISGELGVSKPDPGFFDKAFEIIGSPDRRDVLIVGDSLSSDILGAMNAGVDCCWYNPGGADLPGQYFAKYQISKLQELQQ